MMTGSSIEPSQIVIPTEDPQGPSGGIYEIKQESASSFPHRFLRSLASGFAYGYAGTSRSFGRNDNQTRRRHADGGLDLCVRFSDRNEAGLIS